jgi:hypothetical protein
MRFYLKKRTPNRIEFGIIYGGIALLMLCVGRLLPVLSIAPDCVFKELTGMPCPTCGATRSVVHLAHGEIISAIAMNPLITLCLITATVYFVASIVLVAFDLPRVTFILDDKETNVTKVIAVMILLIQWAYLIILF